MLHLILALGLVPLAQEPCAPQAELGAPQAEPRAPWELREALERATDGGLQRDEVLDLLREVREAAERASSRGHFLGLAGLLADLAHAAPAREARSVRATALGFLAQRDSDTLRWSTLVLERFVPPFEKLPRELWAGELSAYEESLERLLASEPSPRAAAELAFAKVFARVAIARRFDWLTEVQRTEAVDALARLRARCGERPCPGTDPAEGQTLGLRATRFEYELVQLAFGAPAPATSGIDLQGRTVDLSALRGRVVALDFWTSFCQPCLALVPSTKDLLGGLANEPFTYLGVCGDPDRAQGLATAQRYGMTWRNLWDGPAGPDGPAARAWNVSATGWPTVIVLDHQGRIRAKLYGAAIEEQLPTQVRALLREAKAAEAGASSAVR